MFSTVAGYTVIKALEVSSNSSAANFIICICSSGDMEKNSEVDAFTKYHSLLG